MSDRELLELAAKAAGITLFWGDLCKDIPICQETSRRWNPFADDGDALRLSANLNIDLVTLHADDGNLVGIYARPFNRSDCCVLQPIGENKNAARRRAIVRAAAEIGKAMP